jgi:hypothetical protein
VQLPRNMSRIGCATLIPFHPGSVVSLRWMKARRCAASLSMKGVPGVITFESKAPPSFLGGTWGVQGRGKVSAAGI